MKQGSIKTIAEKVNGLWLGSISSADFHVIWFGQKQQMIASNLQRARLGKSVI